MRRAEVVRQRTEALNKLLHPPLESIDDFLSGLEQLDCGIEGREDLQWTIQLFDAGRAFLSGQRASAHAQAELLRRYAGHVGMRDQCVLAATLLKESLVLVPPESRGNHTLRSEILTDLGGVLASMGEVDGAEQCLQEAATLFPEPTTRIYSLWRLADHRAARGNRAVAQHVVTRLRAYLRSTPALPFEARIDGWQRLVTYHSDHGTTRQAVDAQWVLVKLALEGAPADLLRQLQEVYRVAQRLNAKAREQTAQKTLEFAALAGDESLRVSLLFELAGIDVETGQGVLGKKRLEQAVDAIAQLGERASCHDAATWRVRREELLQCLTRLDRGERVGWSQPMYRYVDEQGDPISPSDLLEMASSISPQARSLMEQVFYRPSPDTSSAKSLPERMAALDASPPLSLDAGGWMTIQEAIREGEAQWAMGFVTALVEREANGEAHPFAIQELMQSLLDAFAAIGDWEGGRRRLRWWRELIAQIDHPRSTRLFRNYEAESQWESLAGNSAAASATWKNYVAFAAEIMGSRHPEVSNLRSRATR